MGCNFLTDCLRSGNLLFIRHALKAGFVFLFVLPFIIESVEQKHTV